MLGCGSGGSNGQGNSNSYAGHWTGTEVLPGGNGTLSFQVQTNSTIFCFEFSDPNNPPEFSNTGCADGSAESFPVTGNTFSLPQKTYPFGPLYGDGGTYSLTGQFTSLTQANGTLVVLNSTGTPITCNWTASLP
jgi:hypothetical protein